MIPFSTFRKLVSFFQTLKISENFLKVVKTTSDDQVSFLWSMLRCQTQPQKKYIKILQTHVNEYYRRPVTSPTQKGLDSNGQGVA